MTNYAPGAVVALTASDPEALRSLYAWLTGEDELRGQVRMATGRPAPGELGAITDTLEVVLAPGGAAAALAATVIAWARRQRTDLRLTLRRPDGSDAELDVRNLRGLDAAGLPAVIEALQRTIDGGDDGAEDRPRD